MSYRKDFPIFSTVENLHYMDNGATSQKPKAVLDALMLYYTTMNGNAGRGSHDLAIKSELAIEEARAKVADFVGVSDKEQIIFTKNATESLNIIAFRYFAKHLNKGDEIIIPISNHHANLVTWQEVCNRTGAVLKYIPIDENTDLDMEAYKAMLSEKTKLVAFSGMVNATGVINPYEEMIQLAKSVGALTLLDAAQLIHHKKLELEQWDCDFMVFSGHKIFSAFGVGVLYGKKEHLQKTDALLYGGEMIEYVEKFSSTYRDAPIRFEGGTMNSAAIYSLGAAIDYVNSIGYDKIHAHIHEIDQYAIAKLKEIGGITFYGLNAKNRSGVISFNVGEVHSHDTAHILNEYGVMVRSGHHCTQPLMAEIGAPSCCRASFSIYNEKQDIDALVEGIKKVKEIFGA
ncbi:MAG: SufS family cysteine desulfurase [Bacillota bacterium]|nr:SufS family cysteine desulfurase [Bacillota bacterium]